MSLRDWWRRRAEAAKARTTLAAKEVEEERVRSDWRCKHCGDPATNAAIKGRSTEDPGSCEMCERIRDQIRRDHRKRIADLAATVAGKNVQHSLRGGVDAQMTAEVAWEVAEALFRKECGG